MRKHCMAVFSAALVGSMMVGSAARAAVNLLADPGFENTAGGLDASQNDQAMSTGPWNGWNNWVPPYKAYYTASVHEFGTQAGKTFSQPNAGIYQTVAGTAGTTYTGSGDLLDSSTDAMTGGAGQTVDVRLIFSDAGNNVLSTVVSTTMLTGASPKDVWTPVSVTAVAPAGTTQVEWMAFMNNPSGGGSFFVDNASLTAGATPEPASLGLLGMAGVGLLRRRRA